MTKNAQAEPVAWMYSAEREEPFTSVKRWPPAVVEAQCWIETPLYASPPPQAEASLTQAVEPTRIPCPDLLQGDHGEAVEWITANCTAIRRDNGDMDYSLGAMIAAYEAGKASPPPPQPDSDLERAREALEKCRDQFAFYAREHLAAGKFEKSATNQHFADMATSALNRLGQESDAGEAVAAWDDGKSYHSVQAKDRIRLWFFREISSEQRLALFRLFELPVDEIGMAHSHQRLALNRVLRQASPPPQADADLIARAREAVINSPETADFMAGVPVEAAHQRERWGVDHDAGKTPFAWFWLIGHLAQKAADAASRGDVEKAKHHTISTAAALANWHAALTGADTRMRPGIAPPAALGDGS